MQEPTHILTGAIIQKSFEGSKHPKLALGLTAVIGFLSHGFLDKLANLTYHPSKPDFHSPVWVGYHSFVVVATVAFLVLWWRKFKWGIIFACLPDVDWVFVHGRELFNYLFHTQSHFYPRPYIHGFDGFIWDHIPPFSFVTPYLDHLPNLRQNPRACVFEFVLVALLLLVLKLITMGKRQPLRSGNAATAVKPEHDKMRLF
ncbi:MAG TPA: hypothetical protein VNV43_04420 [Candidatus Acidoferrales bacterium]|jgi:hypothetical protein|nr:hypothetical protein [Candidatus Acidoferrales bacterium]